MNATADTMSSGELAERHRLAQEIADDCARADIECSCVFETLGNGFTWYDTSVTSIHGQRVDADIPKALRYLDLRRRVVRHPTLPHLVRFAR